MKCKNCDGSGIDMFESECRFCGGMGVVEPLTEQEYIQTCNTEQLAEFLEKITDPRVGYLDGYWQEWLKQPHTPFS